jgi:hypothetical protein
MFPMGKAASSGVSELANETVAEVAVLFPANRSSNDNGRPTTALNTTQLYT